MLVASIQRLAPKASFQIDKLLVHVKVHDKLLVELLFSHSQSLFRPLTLHVQKDKNAVQVWAKVDMLSPLERGSCLTSLWLLDMTILMYMYLDFK